MNNINQLFKKKNLADLETKTIGNRAMAIGYLGLVGCGVIATKVYTLDEISTNEFFNYLSSFLSALSIYKITDTYTDSGKITYKMYEKTKKHIKKTNSIDEKFVKKIFGRDVDNTMKNSKMWGYCEWQGIYLGAKEMGKLPEFKQIQKKHYSKKIPLI